jgi:hypothetical protein
MAEGRYGPKGATLEDLQQEIADLRSEIDRLNPEATDKKRSKLLAAAINEETRPSVGDLRPFPGHGFASAQTRLITVGGQAPGQFELTDGPTRDVSGNARSLVGESLLRCSPYGISFSVGLYAEPQRKVSPIVASDYSPLAG